VDFAFKERGLWPRSPPTIPTFGYVSYLKQSRKIPPTNQAKAAHSLGFLLALLLPLPNVQEAKR